MVFVIVLKLDQKQTLSVCVSPQAPITGASYTKKKCEKCTCAAKTENRLKGLNLGVWLLTTKTYRVKHCVI